MRTIYCAFLLRPAIEQQAPEPREAIVPERAFAQPGKILVQLARMPDNVAYICVARSVTKRAGAYLKPTRQFAIGLGCDVRHAGRIAYSNGYDLGRPSVTPIGPA